MSDREQSPDWLRCFQAPGRSFFSVSSDSDDSPSGSPARKVERKSTKGLVAEENENKDFTVFDVGDDTPVKTDKKPVTAKKAQQAKPKAVKEETPRKGKQAKSNALVDDVVDANGEAAAIDDDAKKAILPNVASRVPLFLPDKVQRTKALVECDGDSIDLSGDIGAVGRVVISKTSLGEDEMLLDLKGTMYKSTIVPSATFCIVSFGQTEAKIEAIMSDFVQLKPHSNVFEAETMIEGTLDGFSFDSEDEAEKVPKTASHGDQNNENGDHAEGKSKGSTQKSPGSRKRVKSAAKPGRPAKKVVKKPQAAKKAKRSKK